MLKLHARLSRRWDAEPLVARISCVDQPSPIPGREALLIQEGAQSLPDGYSLYLKPEHVALSGAITEAPNGNVCELPSTLGYLSVGDIVRISPQYGELWVMYRRASQFNSMLLTERCNSDCIMCSQPPKAADDSFLVEAYLEAIPLMSPETRELGITGGEPTLLGPNLLRLIGACREHLPQTALHLLSNGRMFSYLSLCQAIAEIGHSDLVIGIPLYSDIANQHDFVVQAPNAFDQTLRGIMNLRRCGVRIEIRVVLHRLTIERLPHLARFIARNLPFVDHVALMGLEMMGYVRMNLDALWSDPADYQPSLAEAVRILARHRMNVSIYNHQLCILDRELWPYARKSISDWKNEYVEACDDCAARDACGGFFSSSGLRRSGHIKPISATELSCGADPVLPHPVTV